MNRRDVLAVLGVGGLVSAGAAVAAPDDKSSAKKDAKLDWSKFPKLTGKVKHVLGHLSSYVPPEPGESFRVDLRDVPRLTRLTFEKTSKRASYIQLLAPVEVESIHYYTNGVFDHVRLVSKSKDPALADHFVTIDILPATGKGRESNYVKVWVVVQSQGVVSGVALLEGGYEGEFPNRVK
jgi:hypothetical protein